MQDAASIVRWMHEKYEAVAPSLDELGRRRWAAAEARSLGYGGVTLVHQGTGIAMGTIRRGLAELSSPELLVAGRQRRAGCGRKKLIDNDAKLLQALLALVEPAL